MDSLKRFSDKSRQELETATIELHTAYYAFGTRKELKDHSVLTKDGSAYSFALAYRSRLWEAHRFVNMGESIGNIGPKSPTGYLKPETEKLSKTGHVTQ